MKIAILGAGAFGTALAICLARQGRDVVLWGRDLEPLRALHEAPKLPGIRLPDALGLEADLAEAATRDVLLLALPAQQIAPFSQQNAALLAPRHLVACCKGIDIKARIGPAALLARAGLGRSVSILTGPSFAADIARDLPTALTLACRDAAAGRALQGLLSGPTLRLYLSDDLAGAELGGALKNVIAIACGVAIGAGLGESARAALMTRGFAEMSRLAPVFGAEPSTLTGLSGLGDLALTCGSDLSRNFRFGQAIGAGNQPDPDMTVEGAATAEALIAIAAEAVLDLPICAAVAALARGEIGPEAALADLMARPLRAEA